VELSEDSPVVGECFKVLWHSCLHEACFFAEFIVKTKRKLVNFGDECRLKVMYFFVQDLVGFYWTLVFKLESCQHLLQLTLDVRNLCFGAGYTIVHTRLKRLVRFRNPLHSSINRSHTMHHSLNIPLNTPQPPSCRIPKVPKPWIDVLCLFLLECVEIITDSMQLVFKDQLSVWDFYNSHRQVFLGASEGVFVGNYVRF
jgi:hypothetical protein